ncbi:MAG: hypothetical protein HOP12_16210 [Candidatus Eisenbacteria bacterium]|uniref:Uncharacterized protein n=1 Tax=Eiseniibacteriota bacterium TaxID=2212470 RepID=A0A849SU80_UNCEI|nr:hypothetical protein [Candidatus Eisenbacteria bacterium]
MLISVLGAFALGLVMMPSLLLVAPAAWFSARGQTWGVVAFSVLVALYSYAVITVWGFVVFWFFLGRAHNLEEAIPLMLLGYACATGPLSFMASNDDDASASHFTVFIARLALLAVITVLLASGNIPASVIAFLAIMASGYAFQVISVIRTVVVEPARG